MAINNEPWAKVLSDLITSGTKAAGFKNDEEAAIKAATLFTDARGLSEKNIYNYRSRIVKSRIRRDLVEKFAKLYGGVPEDWVRQVLPDNTSQSLLREADTILKMQVELAAGDSVTIIAVREFLEASSADVAAVVLKNLAKGVRYTYCFPDPNSGPHGDAAQRSFAKFIQDRVVIGPFNQAPKVFGFAVDSTRFPYFTPLCSLVHFETPKAKLKHCFGYIEISKDDSGSVERAWYSIENSVWDKIEGSLELARSPVSELHLPIYPLNPQLRTVASVYANWFSSDANVLQYRKLRPVLGHAGDACVEDIKRALATHKLDSSPTRYLDIGCGDAEITARIAGTLALRNSTEVTAIDVAPAQIKAAEETLKRFPGKSEPLVTSFEKFSPQMTFHVITAIHSLYVVDEAYLRRIFQLLAPGGVALIWMACGEQNIVDALTNKLDNLFWNGQRRNTAEDILNAARDGGLSPYVERSERWIPSLLDGEGQPTPDAGQLIDYCALRQVERASSAWAAVVNILKNTRSKNGEHPLHDLLITIKRRPTPPCFELAGRSREY